VSPADRRDLVEAALPLCLTAWAKLAWSSDVGADRESAACRSPKAAIAHRARQAMVARLTYDRGMPVSAAK